MDSATHGNRYTAAWAAPEIHRGANPITWRVDVFAFGMVVIEVGPRALSHLVSEVDGRMIRLTFGRCLRFLQENIPSMDLQLQSLLRRLWAANAQLVRRRRGSEG